MKTQVIDARVTRVERGVPDPTLAPRYCTVAPIVMLMTEIRIRGSPTMVIM